MIQQSRTRKNSIGYLFGTLYFPLHHYYIYLKNCVTNYMVMLYDALRYHEKFPYFKWRPFKAIKSKYWEKVCSKKVV